MQLCHHFTHQQYRNAETATNTRGNTASTTSAERAQHKSCQGIAWPSVHSLKEVWPYCKHQPNPTSCLLNLTFLAVI